MDQVREWEGALAQVEAGANPCEIIVQVARLEDDPEQEREFIRNLGLVKERRRTIEATRVRLAKPFLDGKRGLDEFFKAADAPYAKVEAYGNRVLLDLSGRRQMALAEARRKATEDAAKLQAKLERQAERAEDKGQLGKAQDLRLNAALTVAPVIPEPAKVEGASFPKTWKGRVTNIRDLCAAIAAGTVPTELVNISQGAVDTMARGVKGKIPVPGIEWYEDEHVRLSR